MSNDADFNRVRIDDGVTRQLQNLKKNTGLTPNYLARIGLVYSLNEQRPPNPTQYDTDGQEFNRFTLLGEHDALYMALVRQRLLNEGRNPEEELYNQFLAHLNRGVETLNGRVDGLTDLYSIIPQEIQPNE